MNSRINSRGIPKPMAAEPIRSLKDIERIKAYLLKKNKRDYMLFTVGINIGLRIGDLLSLKIKDVYSDGMIKDKVCILEEKTGKFREFVLNNSAKEAILVYLNSLDNIKPNDYLFKSQKGGAITKQQVHNIIKNTMKELNIKGQYSSHTLRKTFSYQIYIQNIKTNPGILNTLQKILNHSSPAITLSYIGITKEIIEDIYSNLNL